MQVADQEIIKYWYKPFPSSWELHRGLSCFQLICGSMEASQSISPLPGLMWLDQPHANT